MDGPEPLEGAEVGGPEQGGWLGQFHRPAIRQKPSHKLGAEKVVPPLEGQVKIAGERPKHTVMVLLPLGVHGLKLAAEGYVGVLAHPQLIEAAGYCPPAAGDLLLHQSGGEGKVFVFSGKAVKGSSGPIQPNRGVGIVVLGGQVDQPGEPGA